MSILRKSCCKKVASLLACSTCELPEISAWKRILSFNPVNESLTKSLAKASLSTPRMTAICGPFSVSANAGCLLLRCAGSYPVPNAFCVALLAGLIVHARRGCPMRLTHYP